MAEESGEVGRDRTKVSSAAGGISTLIRHLLCKCHLPQGEGKKRLPLGEAVERSETDENYKTYLSPPRIYNSIRSS